MQISHALCGRMRAPTLWQASSQTARWGATHGWKCFWLLIQLALHVLTLWRGCLNSSGVKFVCVCCVQRADVRPFQLDAALLPHFELVNKLWDVIA